MKFRICIICEGYEEEDYFNKLISLNIFHSNYQFKIINAKGISNIYNRYHNKYAEDSYHLVLIFCDTDKDYQELKDKINKMHNNPHIAEKIVFFANPCTMQIMLSHFAKVSLQKASKKTNEKIIEELTNIPNYDATDDDRNALMKKINRTNYKKMKENLNDISSSDSTTPSTNFLTLLTFLENEDSSWIKELNDEIIYSKEN